MLNELIHDNTRWAYSTLLCSWEWTWTVRHNSAQAVRSLFFFYHSSVTNFLDSNLLHAYQSDAIVIVSVTPCTVSGIVLYSDVDSFCNCCECGGGTFYCPFMRSRLEHCLWSRMWNVCIFVRMRISSTERSCHFQSIPVFKRISYQFCFRLYPISVFAP